VANVRFAQISLLHQTAILPRVFWLRWALGLFLAGCSAPSPAPLSRESTPAHLTIINQTDYEWRIVIARSSGELAHDSRLQSRASLTVDLAGGDYVIEQTVLSENASPGLSRKISARLDSGQAYRWRLATLLSEPADNAVSP
jgi:hypothetical protein